MKGKIKAETRYDEIKEIVRGVDDGNDEKKKYICDILGDKSRICAHLKNDPTIWKGEHFNWYEEVWTKAIDIKFSNEVNNCFCDSEVPFFNAGNVDIVCRNKKTIRVFELKVGEARKALRDAIFYSMVLWKYLKSERENCYNIQCGIILVPKKGEVDCKISNRMKKLLEEDIECFNKKLRGSNIKVLTPLKVRYDGEQLPQLMTGKKVITSPCQAKKIELLSIDETYNT